MGTLLYCVFRSKVALSRAIRRLCHHLNALCRLSIGVFPSSLILKTRLMERNSTSLSQLAKTLQGIMVEVREQISDLCYSVRVGQYCAWHTSKSNCRVLDVVMTATGKRGTRHFVWVSHPNRQRLHELLWIEASGCVIWRLSLAGCRRLRCQGLPPVLHCVA
jgi:hypothetical protein